MPTITELRESRGWSRQELAKRAGVTRMAVWNWENNRRVPRADQLKAVAAVFGVSMDDVILPNVPAGLQARKERDE
jgi:transcriptional regulator with XRE-family HTH domain